MKQRRSDDFKVLYFSKFCQKRTGLLQYKTKIERVLEDLDMNPRQLNVAYISEFPKWDKLNDVPLSNFAASSQSAVKRKKATNI